MPSAEQQDFNQFLLELEDNQLKQRLISAFNMTRLSFENLDLLNGLTKNRN
jgi:hypothetical protein